MNISELVKEAHDNAVNKGFYDCIELKMKYNETREYKHGNRY